MPLAHAGSRVVAIAVLVASLVAVVPPATADPVYPSQDQVDRAKGAVRSQASRISSIENDIARLSSDLETKQVAAQVADQKYLQAQQVLDEKTKAAQSAQKKADAAKAELGTARAQVGRIAADMYRNGGTGGSVQALLDSDGPSDAFDRAESLQLLGRQRDQTFQNADAVKLISDLLQKQADTARKQQESATTALHSAAREAQSSANAAQAAVTTTRASRDRAITQLAKLRSTSVRLERQRQAGIAAEEQRRREAAARAAAIRQARELAAQQAAARARAARQSAASSSSSSGSGSSGSSGSGVSSSRSGGSTSSHVSAPRVQYTAPRPAVSSGSAVETAIAFAKSKIGTMYLWGGTGPRYDCSGLTQAAYAAAGISIGRTTYDQYPGANVPLAQMRRGDLIFYGGSQPYHVAMYLGGGQMIEAPRTGLPVRITAVRYANASPYVLRVA